jgi:hypothetical protein
VAKRMPLNGLLKNNLSVVNGFMWKLPIRCLVARSQRKVYTLQQAKTGLSEYCRTSWEKIQVILLT